MGKFRKTRLATSGREFERKAAMRHSARPRVDYHERSSDAPSYHSERSRPRDSDRFFNKDSERPSRSFDRPRRSFSRPGNELEFFDVICAKCGKKTKVPFKPTGNKPVLCRDCFTKKEDSPRSPRESSSRPAGMDAQTSYELQQINKKLEKILKALQIEE